MCSPNSLCGIYPLGDAKELSVVIIIRSVDALDYCIRGMHLLNTKGCYVGGMYHLVHYTLYWRYASLCTLEMHCPTHYRCIAQHIRHGEMLLLIH